MVGFTPQFLSDRLAMARAVVTNANELFDDQAYRLRGGDGVSGVDYMRSCIDRFHQSSVVLDSFYRTLSSKIAAHASLRLIIFYYTLVVYYKSDIKKLRYCKASMQLGRGSQRDKTSAAHHSIFAQLDDNYWREIPNKLEE